ncbi:UDP-4-amino-4,6-dideoxy-N-acetyl-beta-L-altrosamine N-acetyltransferase [Vibrio sp. S4M6]|uniref:UDP-4-amino-4, 6-dideoxy-N-acetyl-beta-L-altrosamine N-acetyltransferase n=1 Tax=Vibrio sinus TaxID=2946865 RepID=UPI00202A12AD|nr:UDP-4-amino-4,6-dideoxy-N-acetyl-beta-L-altrosamine N-acetyltransferase [Vibrio sinus]MCL9781546.1 UDP-4-amino-4,6-dideoxy-N-acetyl-beta-L-altrosamine N-acetyltransferase [Vibrio sinus]
MNGNANLLSTLRLIRDSELEMMLSWRNAPTVRENMYTTHEISLNDHLTWYSSIKQSEQFRYFMYEFQNVPLGIVGFTGIDTKNQNSPWAFYASPEAPKGTGSRMEFVALDYAFGELGLRKLWCEVLDFNKPVIRLHEKFGFNIAGQFKEQYFRDGLFFDVFRLELHKSDWLDIRPDILEKLNRLTRR